MKSIALRGALGCVTLVAIMVAVLVGRTLTFESHQLSPQSVKIEVDEESVAKRLGAAIQFKTISHAEPSKMDAKAFLDFALWLEQTYGRAHQILQKKTVGDHTLLFEWPGKQKELPPILLMAHYDVVPIEPGTQGDWKYPAFSGMVAEKKVWGRGAIDDKGPLIGIFEAVEGLMQSGYQPERTVYFAFGHDEEVGGNAGNLKIAERFKAEGVRLAWVLDEGLVITDGIMAGVKPPVALIGIAEKGYLSLSLRARGEGGHSSMPPAHSAVGKLAKAITLLEENPFDAGLDGPAEKLFEAVGPELDFGKRLLFANLWLFESLVVGELAKKPATNALVRTTIAATMFQGPGCR